MFSNHNIPTMLYYIAFCFVGSLILLGTAILYLPDNIVQHIINIVVGLVVIGLGFLVIWVFVFLISTPLGATIFLYAVLIFAFIFFKHNNLNESNSFCMLQLALSVGSRMPRRSFLRDVLVPRNDRTRNPRKV